MPWPRHPVSQWSIFVTVPDGWRAEDNWAVTGPDDVDPPAGIAVGFWSVRNLYADPLNAAGGTLDPPVGPTVDDLAEALASHPGWTATAPTDVTVDGHARQARSH